MSALAYVVTEETDETPSGTLLTTTSVEEAFQTATACAKQGNVE